jgi:two-component system, response regulator YesN
MKILIVEDEEITRTGLKMAIETEDSFTVIADCSNGKQALEQLNKHRDTDVILLDLNMPIMDGLEFLDYLDPSFCGQVIVLSSYDDLDHIKEAMKKGAADYFHKPTMSPQKIITMLKSVRNKPKNTTILQVEEWIKQMINTPSLHLVNQSNHWIASHQKIKGVILLSINDFSSLSISNYEIKELLQKWKSVFSFQGELVSYKEGEFILIEKMQTNSLLNQYTHLQKICLSIRDYFIQAKQLTVSFGISNSTADAQGLKKCLQQAEQALSNEFFNGRGSIQFFKKEEKIKVDRYNPQTSDLWNALEQIDQESMVKCLEYIFDKLKDTKNRDLVIMVTIELKMELKRRMENFKCNTQTLNISPKSGNYFLDVKQEIIDEFCKMIRWLDEFENKNYSPIVKHILHYLNEHFYKDISLDSLAKQVQTNPSYLSRIFKEQTGQRLSDFIMNLRMERAKDLLKEQRLRTKDVALAVGYENERYFSQIFKRYTGLSPSKFRK